MIVISITSLIISFLIFYGVRYLVFMMEPSNYVFANLLVILVGTAVVSLVFTMRQFRYLGKDKWRNQAFHNTLIRTFLINFVIIFIISQVM